MTCITQFSPAAARDWLGYGTRHDKRVYTCHDCILPECAKCKRRPVFPQAGKKLYTEDGKYYCTTCMYPPCIKCKRPRNKTGSHVMRFNESFVCADCSQTEETRWCKQCKTEKNLTEFLFKSGRHRDDICKTCKWPPCPECGAARPQRSEYTAENVACGFVSSIEAKR